MSAQQINAVNYTYQIILKIESSIAIVEQIYTMN